MEIGVAFNFIYIMHYNVIFKIFLQLSTHELNHQLSTY
jgi:hypothetical protein